MLRLRGRGGIKGHGRGRGKYRDKVNAHQQNILNVETAQSNHSLHIDQPNHVNQHENARNGRVYIEEVI